MIVGKTNMDEFAMGSSNENVVLRPVTNPWNTALCRAALGRIGGGRGRAARARRDGHRYRRLDPPAGAVRGISGLKPTYGLCSRYGLVAFASSLDQAGPFAQTAEDCALLLTAIAGHDPRDATSSTARETTRGSCAAGDGRSRWPAADRPAARILRRGHRRRGRPRPSRRRSRELRRLGAKPSTITCPTSTCRCRSTT